MRIDQAKLERARARVEYQQRHQLAGTARVRGRAQSGIARQRSASGTSGYDSEEQSNCPFANEVSRARSRPAQPANGTSRCSMNLQRRARRTRLGQEKPQSARPRPAVKRATREAASERVKVGNDTIVMPKSLATNLTPKDLKKLRAVFRRAHKRGKKRTAKASAAKNRQRSGRRREKGDSRAASPMSHVATPRQLEMPSYRRQNVGISSSRMSRLLARFRVCTQRALMGGSSIVLA